MAAEPTPRGGRLATMRARTTLAATLVVGLALAVTAVSLVTFLHLSLVEQVGEVAEVRAENVAELARVGSLDAVLPTLGDDEDFTQVVDDSGRIIAATRDLPLRQPVAAFRPAGLEAEARTVHGIAFGDGHDFRVVALRTGTPGGPVIIYSAASLRPVDETVTVLRRALGLGAPLLLVLVALTTWVVVGRALRPVEAIRAEVADISERSLDRRVPVPATDDEISRLAGTMNTMLDRLQAAAQRQRRFVADASHELQTPLASARTDLEVALAHPDGGNWRDTAVDLLAANRRMERLVRDLLFLARSDDAAPRPANVPVDLDDIVLAESARLRGNGHLRVDTGGVSAAAVDGRRDELTRAVRNLLDNAEHHAASAVTVELATDDARVVLVVQDDGPGIPAGDRERVFERFTRLDHARSRDGGGTGLGLSIAREIIDAHGGTITVDDTSAGARFVVELPSR